MARDEIAPRFFVDENDLALARALASARHDVVHPGHGRLAEVPKGTPDVDWMPIVAAKDLVVISRDKKIRTRTAELAAYRECGLRVFFLTGTTSQDTWESLSILVRRWEQIEEIITEEGRGPWAYSATASGGPKRLELRSGPLA